MPHPRAACMRKAPTPNAPTLRRHARCNNDWTYLQQSTHMLKRAVEGNVGSIQLLCRCKVQTDRVDRNLSSFLAASTCSSRAYPYNPYTSHRTPDSLHTQSRIDAYARTGHPMPFTTIQRYTHLLLLLRSPVFFLLCAIYIGEKETGTPRKFQDQVQNSTPLHSCCT